MNTPETNVLLAIQASMRTVISVLDELMGHNGNAAVREERAPEDCRGDGPVTMGVDWSNAPDRTFVSMDGIFALDILRALEMTAGEDFQNDVKSKLRDLLGVNETSGAQTTRALHPFVMDMEVRFQRRETITREEMRDYLQDVFDAGRDEGHMVGHRCEIESRGETEPEKPVNATQQAPRLPSECIHGVHLSIYCHGCNGHAKLGSTAGVDRSGLN